MEDLIISADAVLTPEATLRPGWVHITRGTIRTTGPGAAPAPGQDPGQQSLSRIHLSDTTLVPGFVDVHTHGGGGFSYPEGDPDAAAAAAHAHRMCGTTTTMASLVTAPIDTLERAVRALAELVDEGLLAGLHLEGPWLSEKHPGAHEPALLRPPRAEDVQRLLAAGRGSITMVTIAPELDGATDAIHRIIDHGAVAAIGHTDASYATTRNAIEAGARLGTHLFNAMRVVHHREPGPATALLEDPRCRVELIADGVHLHDAMLRQALRLAGSDRLLLVTDAMAAAAAGDGRFQLGGREVTVRNGEARLTDTGGIAGSTLTQHAALRRFIQATGAPLGDGLQAAAHTPAQTIGCTDVGALAPGYRADLVVLDQALDVAAVMRAGEWVLEPGTQHREHA